jgi:hypothetical protein
LEIPAGPTGSYRLAQLDDYARLPRKDFPWQPPFRLVLNARASAACIPGTWGFGLWNNPFGFSIFTGVELLRLPALPNTAWFFHGSPPNYLSLRDDLPAEGWTAGVFSAPRLPALLMAFAAPVLPLLLLRPAARLLRRLGRAVVRQSAVQLDFDVQAWHAYGLHWEAEQVDFFVDGEHVLHSPLSPRGPLGLVLWVDNQYACLPPSGGLGFGTLPSPEPAWIEIRDLEIL